MLGEIQLLTVEFADGKIDPFTGEQPSMTVDWVARREVLVGVARPVLRCGLRVALPSASCERETTNLLAQLCFGALVGFSSVTKVSIKIPYIGLVLRGHSIETLEQVPERRAGVLPPCQGEIKRQHVRTRVAPQRPPPVRRPMRQRASAVDSWGIPIC